MENIDIETSSSIFDLLKTISMKTRHYLIKEFSDKELTIHQQYILKTIQKNPEINLTNLGSCLGLAKSSISLIINKLTDEGFVQRIENSQDRRNKTISLTENGKRALKKSKTENKMLFNHLVSDLSQEELTLINSCLIMLNSSIDNKTAKWKDFIYGS